MQKNHKIIPVKTINITGAVSMKLGCFGDKFRTQTFINEVFNNVSKQDYLNFKMNFAADQKEYDDFSAKLDSCDSVIQQ